MDEELKIKRATAKGQFTRSEKRLRDAVTNMESTPISTIERRYTELESKWNTVQEAHDRYVATLEQKSTPENPFVEADENDWINEVADHFDSMEVEADRRIEAYKMKLSSVKTEEANQITASPLQDTQLHTDVQPKVMSNPIQLERIKLDKFNGDIRKYPKFKEQFELYVKPLCTEAQLPFVLKSHLVEEVKDEVDNVDDNMETLWERLDKRYGNCGKLVDVILADIARAPKGDGRSTLTMINTVEKAYRDLSRMGKESEMKNGTIISMIEKKLPEEIRYEWLQTIAENTEGDANEKFSLLLRLLRKFKTMIEYDQASIRRPADKRSVANFASGASQGRKNEKNTCWIHTSEKHPIWVCQAFKAKSVAERINLVKQNHACEACLEVNCTGVVDPTNCRKEFKCVIQGCDKNHNKLLHQ
jgi:hypothetical protein